MTVVARQQDAQGESALEEHRAGTDPSGTDPAEGFGGEVTSVAPDGTSSSRWDRNAQDEDALLHEPSTAEEDEGPRTVSG